MFIVHVNVKVKPEFVDDFISVSLKNAKASLGEPGIVRFDVIQNETEPTQFVLVQVYKTENDPTKHKLTQHYQEWQESVTEMMVTPRTKTIYKNLFPDDSGW
jgi:(4S)-4-hydroxy-5-phosphonooxypentane-2,3-dione isomerase